MLYLHEEVLPPPTEGGWSAVNEEGQVMGKTHLWEGTLVVKSQYTNIYEICICKC